MLARISENVLRFFWKKEGRDMRTMQFLMGEIKISLLSVNAIGVEVGMPMRRSRFVIPSMDNVVAQRIPDN